LITVGVSDFLQQHNGDVAFAEVKPAGSLLEAGDELAVIETIKVDIVLSTPVPGRVAEINPALDTGPEVINFEPYGQGWLAVIDPQDWERDRAALLDPQAYFELMCSLAEAELRQP
jgi:glycine cleavage system H protein